MACVGQVRCRGGLEGICGVLGVLLRYELWYGACAGSVHPALLNWIRCHASFWMAPSSSCLCSGRGCSPDAIAVSIVSDAVLAPRVAIILNDRALAAVLKTSHPQLLLAMSLRDQVRRCPGGACVGHAWGVRGACVGPAWGLRARWCRGVLPWLR